jgi:16S rRNA (guanine527-N7)-methyltransferase
VLPRKVELSAANLSKDRAAAERLIPLPESTKQRLCVYQDLLLRWQGMLNLVSTSTLPHLWTRHIADSAQLRDLAPWALRWADLGSGGGFPGLVVAILLADVAGAEVHLIERDQRKAAFLQNVSRETGAPAIVHASLLEDVLPHFEAIDVVTSRAVAPLAELIGWSLPLLERGAIGLFPKGRTVQQEIDAVSFVNLDLSTLPSRTDASGRIVSVRYKEPVIR